MIKKGKDGLYHPKNEKEVAALIQHAISKKVKVRVRGAAQSAPGSVLTDQGDKNVHILLDKMRSISIDSKNQTAKVSGGCNLGFDPYDPSQKSNKKNGLFAVLQKNRLAIPNVADAIHQTVAGFISTGSSGATMHHSFHQYILSITLVDGTGNIQTFKKSKNLDDPFYGVVVSMGLCGIITSITLQCIPTFDVIGSERTSDMVDTNYDFFGKGSAKKPSLQKHFSKNEFARTLWWPLHTAHRGISWKAKTMKATDYTPTTGGHKKLKIKRYHPVFPKVLGSYIPSESFASTGFTLISSWPKWFYNLLGKSKNELDPFMQGVIQKIDLVAPYLYPILMNLYFPKSSKKNPPQQFWDRWNGSLPMDTIEFSNHLMELDYTEMWFPMSQARKVVNTLKSYYDQGGEKATGFYTVEVLAGKATSFWLSPGYQQDSIRLNFMWFKHGAGSPKDFYQQYYDLFVKKKIPFRMHWGKFLPDPKGTSGPKYLKLQYPKWRAFRKLRKSMDPNGLFVTSYWKEHLGL